MLRLAFLGWSKGFRCQAGLQVTILFYLRVRGSHCPFKRTYLIKMTVIDTWKSGSFVSKLGTHLEAGLHVLLPWEQDHSFTILLKLTNETCLDRSITRIGNYCWEKNLPKNFASFSQMVKSSRKAVLGHWCRSGSKPVSINWRRVGFNLVQEKLSKPFVYGGFAVASSHHGSDLGFQPHVRNHLAYALLYVIVQVWKPSVQTNPGVH